MDLIDKIYCGDSYELIKQIPDNSIDLVIIDPPYEFCMGGKGKSELGNRKSKSAEEIYSLDTDITKKNIVSGGGAFGTKNRNYYSQLNETDVSLSRKKYLDYVSNNGKNEESKSQNENLRFISRGITNEILDELCRVMKKINIYIFCNKNQLRQYIDYFDDKGVNIDLLTWHKTNPIPTCNNTYLSDTEYIVFAREGGGKTIWMCRN